MVSRKNICHILPACPLLITADEIPNPNALAIKSHLNGETMQDWNTDDMIFDVPALIEFLSGSTILSPGSIILTGTPTESDLPAIRRFSSGGRSDHN